MAGYSFFVAVERPLDPGLPGRPYAESAARRLAEAVAAVGLGEPQLLLGSHATLAVVRSRLKRLLANATLTDSVLIHWSAPVVERDRLAAFGFWDAQPDDPAETGLAVADLVAMLEQSPARQVTLLLDCVLPESMDAELRSALENSPKVVALGLAADGPLGQPVAALKATLGTFLVTEAFAGRVPKALDRHHHLTAATLLRALEDELPRLARKYFDEPPGMLAELYGGQNGGEPLADLSRQAATLSGGGLLTPERLKRVAFRAETHGRVKDLQGFRKGYSVPENHSPSNKKFLAKLAAADIKDDLDQVVATSRDFLNYKRKDIDLIADGDGVGTVRTPDFEYTVHAELDPEDPSRVAWRRECAQFADPAFVRGTGFDAVFGKLFDQLAFEFARPVDVAALVDRIEDSPPEGVKISVAADGQSCDIALAGFAGRVVVTRQSLVVRGRAGNAAGLLDQFLAFTATVGPLGEPLALR